MRFQTPRLLVFLIFTGIAHSGYPPDEIQSRAVENLNAATEWVIQNAWNSKVKDSPASKVFESGIVRPWPVQFRMSGGLISVGPKLRCIIFSGAIDREIHCINRIAGERIYEYWFVQTSSHAWPEFRPTISFCITESADEFALREVIFRSDEFIEDYPVSENLVLSFPYSDLEALYLLHAWKFPEGFPNSDLRDFEVIPIGPDSYRKVRVNKTDDTQNK